MSIHDPVFSRNFFQFATETGPNYEIVGANLKFLWFSSSQTVNVYQEVVAYEYLIYTLL